MGRFVPYGVEINGTLVGAITEQSIDSGVEVTAEVTAGATAPQYGEINKIQSMGKFTTSDIPAILGILGSRGVVLSGAGFVLYQLDKEEAGTLKSTSVHRKVAIATGLVVPRTLTAQQGSRATLACEVFAIYDGTNKPVTATTAIALPTGITDLVGYHLGEAIIAAQTITRKTSVSIDFGLEITPEYDDGESYARSLHIAKVNPKLTVKTHDIAKFGDSAIPLDGVLGTHANTSVVLRKRVRGTAAFATGEVHTKITAAGVVSLDTVTSASTNSPHEMGVNVTTLDDQTNDMLVLAFDHELT